MKRSLCIVIIGGLAALLAAAQGVQIKPTQPPGRQPQAAAPKGPQGEAKLRWVCKQLKLDEQQWQQVEALIAVYHATLEEQKQDPVALMEAVRDKFAELQAAQQADDKELTEKLRDELRNMAPGVGGENSFFDSLQQYLTDEQKARLPEVRQRAQKIGDISLQPIHVLRVARDLSLTAVQDRKLEIALADFRAKQAANRSPNAEDTAPADELIQTIRLILTPEQAQQFDQQIDELRMGAPPAKTVILQSPESAQPTEQPAKAEPRASDRDRAKKPPGR